MQLVDRSQPFISCTIACHLAITPTPSTCIVQVVGTLRSLHFVSPCDPRLAVPDRKQKGRVLGGGDSPDYRLLEAVKQAMQLNPAAADAVVRRSGGPQVWP